MLGLTVTMMCGTQMTAFASGLGEEAPVAIETEAKATANEETEEVKVEDKEEKADVKEEVKTEVKEEVVTGTEVSETPVVEETEVKETVAGTEELVGLGVSVEAEAETEAPVVPQTDVEADAPVVSPETEETNKVADIKGELTSVKFDKEVNGVITLTDKDFEESGLAIIDYILYGTKRSGGTDMPIYFDITSKGDFGLLNPQDIDDMGEYNGAVGVYKPDLEEAGGTKTYTGTFIMEETETGGTDDTLDFSITVKYEKGNNGGGTVTPEPEKPQPEPEKPNPDGGNGGTETPDPEQPEKPDGGNGNEEGTQKPDGNEQKPDGNEQKPDDNQQKPDDTQKPDGNEQKPDNTQKPDGQKPVSGQQVQTDNTTNKGNAPKTGDPTTALPFMGAGLSSLGVALGAFFKKRK